MTMREPANASATIRTTFKRADAYRGLITPEIARSILGTMVTHQRPLTRGTVERYKRILQDDEWKYTGQGVIITTNGVGLDAQHRLTAISESGVAGEMLVVLDVDPGMWRYLDQGKPRSGADLIGGGNAVVTAAVCRLLQEEEAGSYRKVIRPNAADVPLILDLYPKSRLPWNGPSRSGRRFRLLSALQPMPTFVRVCMTLLLGSFLRESGERRRPERRRARSRPAELLGCQRQGCKEALTVPAPNAPRARVDCGRGTTTIAHVKAPKRNANLPAWPGSRLERLPRRLRAPLRIVEEPASGT